MQSHMSGSSMRGKWPPLASLTMLRFPPFLFSLPILSIFFSVKILLFWCSALFKCLIIEIVAFCIFATHTRRFTEGNYIAADYVHKRKTLLEQYFIFD